MEETSQALLSLSEREALQAEIESLKQRLAVAISAGLATESHTFDLSDKVIPFSTADIAVIKHAEKENLKTAERYKALSQAAASVVFTADAQGNLTEIPLLHGLDPSVSTSGLGTGWLDAVHPDDRQQAMRRWAEAVSTNSPYQVEFRILMSDGKYRWHQARGVRVLEEDGSTREWIGACVDVHDRVTQERTLRTVHEFSEATRLYRNPNLVMTEVQRLVGEQLQASRVAYAEIDANGSFSGVPNYCNGCEDLDGKYPISGLSSDVSRSLRNGEVLVIDDVSAGFSSSDGLTALAKQGILATICVPLIRNQRIVAILGVHQNTPRKWSSDEVELVIGSAERCWAETQRVRAERELRMSEQRLQRILEAATIGVAVNLPSGVFTYANPPLLKMLGYTREDLLRGDISWSAIQLPELKSHDDVALTELRMNGTCHPFETQLRTKQGGRIPVFVGAAFVPDEAGAGLLGAAFISDLTEAKANEHELLKLTQELDQRVQERTEELTRANRDLNEFSYSVAHDLRAPLRAIVSTSRVLLEDAHHKLSAEEKEMLDRQAVNAVRLAQIVDDLLAFAKLANTELRREPFDMTALVNSIAPETLKVWGIACEMEVQEGMRAVGDPRLVGYALQNLIDNACKFSPEGGKIVVTQQGNTFSIKDEGVGFSMKHAHKLFVAFERLVDQETFPGTGVGLANVKRIVERHGGEIWAESEPGKGALFCFTLGDR